MKLSIVTINRNNAEGLRKTIESVVSQSFKEFDYIVIDGASTDSSVDVIKEYQDKITYWVSEPDSGVYQAMNKGIRKSCGEYILMLNSGDFLVDSHVIERMMPDMHDEEIIQGNVIYQKNGFMMRNRGYGKSDISFIDVMDGIFLHQAMFCKKSVYDQYGCFDESYKKGADTYFFVTALGLGNATFRYVDLDISNFDMNGISSMQDPKWQQIDKEEDARWYGEHVSVRLMELYRVAPKKMRLYDKLHSNKVIWNIVMLLVHISEWFSPASSRNRIEKIE